MAESMRCTRAWRAFLFRLKRGCGVDRIPKQGFLYHVCIPPPPKCVSRRTRIRTRRKFALVSTDRHE